MSLQAWQRAVSALRRVVVALAVACTAVALGAPAAHAQPRTGTADEAETAANPRARSAVLRVAEKLGEAA